MDKIVSQKKLKILVENKWNKIDAAFLHKYGKTNEKVIFPLPSFNIDNSRLKSLWDKTEQVKVVMRFKKPMSKTDVSKITKKQKICKRTI